MAGLHNVNSEPQEDIWKRHSPARQPAPPGLTASGEGGRVLSRSFRSSLRENSLWPLATPWDWAAWETRPVLELGLASEEEPAEAGEAWPLTLAGAGALAAPYLLPPLICRRTCEVRRMTDGHYPSYR